MKQLLESNSFKSDLSEATNRYVQAMMEHAALTSAEKENMQGSGDRMAKALSEIVLGRDALIAELKEVLAVSFPINSTTKKDTPPLLPSFLVEGGATAVNQTNITLTQPNIRAISLCPHHFLPIKYDVAIAIVIPTQTENDEIGWVYGISKYVRAVQTLAKRPVLQEQYARDIVELFTQGIIGGEIEIGNNKVKGCMVVVKGEHGCMSCRGVKTDNPTITHYAVGMSDSEQQAAWNIYNANVK